MKIVIACDSFKGSLSSYDVALAIEKGILNIFPDCMICKINIADGGEGTTDSLMRTLRGTWHETEVCDPLLRPIKTKYGIVSQNKTAIIEMAAASGLTLLDQKELNPMKTTTYGTGELILDAASKGCRNFIIGIGGSATNDGGTGMLRALGFRFLDDTGSELIGGGEILSQIVAIDDSMVNPYVKDMYFTVACDVNNPFIGTDGAAYVFAPQKGASDQMVIELDRGLKNFASVIHKFNGIDISGYPGAGAGGGLAGGFKALLTAELKSGIDMILEAADFDSLLNDCDWVITGEGRMDFQTSAGKAPFGVLTKAKRKNVPVIAITGQIEKANELNMLGFSAVFSIQQGVVSLSEAMSSQITINNIEITTEQIMRLIKYSNQNH